MSPTKQTTLADIAKIANVSLMTVSRAVNNKPGLSDSLRQRILALTEEMDYRPNAFARGLVTQQTAVIGLVVADITDPLYAQIARGVEDITYENHYSLILHNTYGDGGREAAVLEMLWQKGAEGVVLCDSCLRPDLLTDQVKRFPAIVLINRQIDEPMATLVSILVNFENGARRAVSHLIGLGRRRIAFLGDQLNSYVSQQMLAGYKEGLAAAEIPFDELLVKISLAKVEAGRAAVEQLLGEHPDLDAILSFNDFLAIGAIQACAQFRKEVPDEVAIVGFNDIPLAELVRPRLTTMHLPLQQIGRLAARAVIDIFTGKSVQSPYRIEPELYMRESA